MEDQVLAGALDGLRRADGQPDYVQRRACLLSLVRGQQLTTEELRMLKHELSKVSLQRDVVAHLPMELVILVSDYLSADDLVACLQVSRTWREKFLDGQVRFRFAYSHFSSLASEERLIGEPDLQAKTSHALEFLNALMHSQRRSHGWYRSVIIKPFRWADESVYKLSSASASYAQFGRDKDSDEAETVGLDAFYACNRIAWRPEGQIIVVDHLSTRVRKIFTVPGGNLLGPNLRLRALGDRLVVATMIRFLFGWDHESDTFHRVSLPSPAMRCSTQGDRIAVVTSSKEVHIWKFGVSLSKLDTESLLTSLNLPENVLSHWQKNLDVILHPQQPTRSFLATVFPKVAPKHGLTWAVYEFEKEQYNGCCYDFELDVPENPHPPGHPSRELDLAFKCQKADAYGRYSLGFFRSARSGSIQTRDFNQDEIAICSVEFDIYHKSFAHNAYALPRAFRREEHRSYLYYLLNSCHPWNGRLSVHATAGLLSESGCSSSLVATLLPINTTDANNSKLRGSDQGRYRVSPAFNSLLSNDLDSEELEKLERLEYMNVDYYLGTPGLFSVKIMGDNDYLVSLGESGYVVWSFQSHLSTTEADERLIAKVGIGYLRNPDYYAPFRDTIDFPTIDS